MTRPAAAPLRVLVVARREPWPLTSGGTVRLFNFLKSLARDAAVTLALPAEPQHARHLPHLHRVVNAGVPAYPAEARPDSRVPWIIRRVRAHFGYSPAVNSWLAAHACRANYDVALLYGAVNGQYIDAVRVPAVWDAVDELVLYTARDARRRGVRPVLRTARAALLYALFERHVARRAHAAVFASSIDASYARRWAGDARVEAVSNGVDFEYFNGPTQAAEPGSVAFVGSLSFPPNVEGIVHFATRIWPRLRDCGAGRRLLIVGRAPTEAVQSLARLPGVTLHADVPDVRPYLSRAAVVVVPTRLGGGVKNKVLEACAMRRPVVASPRALAGLSARPGVDVLCAASNAAWVQRTRRLLEQPEFAARVAERGQRWVRHAHDWLRLAAHLRALLTAAAGGQHAALREPQGAHPGTVVDSAATSVSPRARRAARLEGTPCTLRPNIRRTCVPSPA